MKTKLTIICTIFILISIYSPSHSIDRFANTCKSNKMGISGAMKMYSMENNDSPDMDKLIKKGMLRSMPKCQGGATYSIVNNKILCSFHDNYTPSPPVKTRKPVIKPPKKKYRKPPKPPKPPVKKNNPERSSGHSHQTQVIKPDFEKIPLPQFPPDGMDPLKAIMAMRNCIKTQQHIEFHANNILKKKEKTDLTVEDILKHDKFKAAKKCPLDLSSNSSYELKFVPFNSPVMKGKYFCRCRIHGLQSDEMKKEIKRLFKEDDFLKSTKIKCGKFMDKIKKGFAKRYKKIDSLKTVNMNSIVKNGILKKTLYCPCYKGLNLRVTRSVFSSTKTAWYDKDENGKGKKTVEKSSSIKIECPVHINSRIVKPEITE